MASVGDKSDEPEIATATIDLELVKKVRAEVPLRRRT